MGKIKEKKKLELGLNITVTGSEDYQTGSWRKEIPVVLKKEELDKHPELALFCPEAAIIYKATLFSLQKKSLTEKGFADGKFSHIDYRYCKGCGICAEYLKGAIIMKKI